MDGFDMSMDDKGGWFIAERKPIGPFAVQDLVARVKNGSVPATAWIWVPDVGEWVAAGAVLAELGQEAPEPANAPWRAVEATGVIAFRSLRLIGASLAAAVIVVLVFVQLFPNNAGIAAIVAGLIALVRLVNETRGVHVDADRIRFPRRLPGVLSFISLSRRSVDARDVLELICSRSPLGFECVAMRGSATSETVLFDGSRERRVFVDAIVKRFPRVGVYRNPRAKR